MKQKAKIAPFYLYNSKYKTTSEGFVNDKWSYPNVIGIFVLFSFVIIFFRLFQLTILRGKYFSNIAFDNKVKEAKIKAPRGNFIDRSGLSIFTSSPLPPAQKIEEYENFEHNRRIINGDAWGSLIGYLNSPNQKRLKEDSCAYKIDQSDYVGQTGLEEVLDCILRGKNGKKIVEIDARGKVHKNINILPPIPGNDIKLTLDKMLQEKIYELVTQNDVKSDESVIYVDQKIAVIVTNPKNGEVLAMLSFPTYNPNVFLDKDSEQISKYLNDEKKPLFNRVLLGTYPPGSVFKPMIAAAGLESKVISKDETVVDVGEIELGNQKFGNWYFDKYGKTEINVDLIKALYRSNDIYFYRLGEKLGSERMALWGRNFGYGKNPNSLLMSANGLIPTDFWKKETIKEPWYQGDSYNTSIGQGYVLTTPLQVHLANQVFANEGSYCPPRYLDKSIDKALIPASMREKAFPECQSVKLSPTTIAVIRQGLKGACESGGTAFPFFDFRISHKNATFADPDSTESSKLGTDRVFVGCKTGTAQSHTAEGKPHAWFSAFAPFENPTIAITVMVEEGGEGSSVAAPLAAKIIKYYLESTQ